MLQELSTHSLTVKLWWSAIPSFRSNANSLGLHLTC